MHPHGPTVDSRRGKSPASGCVSALNPGARPASLQAGGHRFDPGRLQAARVKLVVYPTCIRYTVTRSASAAASAPQALAAAAPEPQPVLDRFFGTPSAAFCGGDCSSLEPPMHGLDEVDGPQCCPYGARGHTLQSAPPRCPAYPSRPPTTGILILGVSTPIMGLMLRLLIRGGPLKRFANGPPIVGVFLAAEVAAMTWKHFSKLNSAQRRRLIALLSQSRGRPRSLSHSEREELGAIFAALEPRLFLGSATRRLSPVPVPKRLLYGPCGSAARTAAQRR